VAESRLIALEEQLKESEQELDAASQRATRGDSAAVEELKESHHKLKKLKKDKQKYKDASGVAEVKQNGLI